MRYCVDIEKRLGKWFIHEPAEGFIDIPLLHDAPEVVDFMAQQFFPTTNLRLFFSKKKSNESHEFRLIENDRFLFVPLEIEVVFGRELIRIIDEYPLTEVHMDVLFF